MRLKIGLVFDTTLDSDAGVQQYFKGLARFLLHNGHDVKFLVPPSKNSGEFKGRIHSFGRHIVLKGNANTVQTGLYFGSRKVKEVLEKENFDIIHIGTPFSPFLGAKVIKYAKCPVISTYMVYGKNFLYRIAMLLMRILYPRVFSKIDVFIAPSEIAREEAEATILKKHRIIPHAVDMKNYSPEVKRLEKFDDGKVNILSLGRFENRKGVSYLLEAYSKVEEACSNTRLIVVGDGPERENLERIAKDLKLSNVEFEGYVDEKLKARYYASADICVFPAIYGECFGIVLIESMASGKVTLAFANEGYRFVLRNIPEMLVENKNIKKLSTEIIRYVKNKKLRDEFSVKCLREAETYSWEDLGKRVVDIYKDLLK